MTTERTTQEGFVVLAQKLGVRKVSLVRDELRQEAGVSLEQPIQQAAAIAVLPNPWVKQGVDSDLSETVEKLAPVLAKVLADKLIDALGGASKIEAFGKAGLVGINGELEHAGALIHTPYFGNIVRELLEGTSVLCFADGRGMPSESIRVPLWHKTHATSRNHYQTMDVYLPDAPLADEICVIAAASTGPRPFPRIGDRRTDGEVTTEILKGLI
jgi:hypothetical protein